MKNPVLEKLESIVREQSKTVLKPPHERAPRPARKDRNYLRGPFSRMFMRRPWLSLFDVYDMMRETMVPEESGINLLRSESDYKDGRADILPDEIDQPFLVGNCVRVYPSKKEFDRVNAFRWKALNRKMISASLDHNNQQKEKRVPVRSLIGEHAKSVGELYGDDTIPTRMAVNSCVLWFFYRMFAVSGRQPTFFRLSKRDGQKLYVLEGPECDCDPKKDYDEEDG